MLLNTQVQHMHGETFEEVDQAYVSVLTKNSRRVMTKHPNRRHYCSTQWAHWRDREGEGERERGGGREREREI